MSHPDAVAAALARLVNGTGSTHPADEAPGQNELSPAEHSPPLEHTPPPKRAVAEAESALETLPTAAAFVADGGEQRLRRVVDDSAEDRLVERSRAVLEALERFRTAADPKELDSPESHRPESPAGNHPDSPEPHRPPDENHFHRGRTTLLKGDGVATER